MSLSDILEFDTPHTPPKKQKKQYINALYDFTLDKLKMYFVDIKKKKDFNILYKGRKTLLGSLLKENDSFIEFGVVNVEGILTNKFISLSFRYVAKREIKDIAKMYIILDTDRRFPILIESKYMELPEYNKHRDKIYKQFM